MVEMVLPVLLVIFKIILSGEGHPVVDPLPEFKNPIARSVEVAVTPLAKL